MIGLSPTLRGQLLRRLLVPLAAVWLLGAVVAYYFAERFSNLAYDRALFDSTRSLAAQVKAADHHIHLDLPKEAEQILIYDEYDTVSYQVKTSNGEVVAGDRDIPPPPAAPEHANNPIYYDSVLHGKMVRVASLYRTVGDDGLHGQEVLVQVAETLRKRRILAEEILTGIVVPQLLLIALAALSVWYGISHGLTPLIRLREAIANRSHRDLSPIAEEFIPGEIRPLIHAINDLMARLSGTMLAQQRFIADASHQLRTPLAGLQAQVELALRDRNHEDTRHALNQIAISAERVSHLAKQLLTLAKAEQGMGKEENLQPINLADVARDVTKKWVFQALKKDIDLGFESEQAFLMIKGDAFLLEEMLGNLIDNAIKYTPAGGRITVKVVRDGSPVLIVEDNGHGIPAEERSRVFDRFYRVLGTDVDGSGLGLAIVRDIMLLHNGEIGAEEAPGGQGLSIVARFPPVHA